MKKDTKSKTGLSVLVIEDNDGDFVLIEDYLIEIYNAVQIVRHTCFRDAVAYLKDPSGAWDLILLDLHLPDRSGLELVEQMVAISNTIPKIILTGYTDLPLAKKSLEIGVDDFLVKDDLNPVILHKSIEFTLSRSEYIRQIETQNEQLRKIAWTQSHEVRAPLARMMGIIELIEKLDVSRDELSFFLNQIKLSAHEMDEIVRRIVNETQTIDLEKYE